MITLLLTTALSLACDHDATPTDLRRAVSQAEIAFAQLDEGSFDRATTDAREFLPCIHRPLSPDDAAAYHRLEGLAAFLAGDRARVVQQFQAVRRIAPDYRLPEVLAPPSHPLRADFDLASNLGTPLQDLPAPKIGSLRVDGTPTLQAPTAQPWIFQHLDDNDVVLATQAISTGGTAPSYRAAARRGPSVPLLAVAGGTGILSALLYGLAASSASRFDDPNTPRGELSGLKSSTNNLVLASAGVGAAAVGSAGLAFSGRF